MTSCSSHAARHWRRAPHAGVPWSPSTVAPSLLAAAEEKLKPPRHSPLLSLAPPITPVAAMQHGTGAVLLTPSSPCPRAMSTPQEPRSSTPRPGGEDKKHAKPLLCSPSSFPPLPLALFSSSALNHGRSWPSRLAVDASRPTQIEDHHRTLRVVLSMLVRGIEPGSCQSSRPSSPFSFSGHGMSSKLEIATVHLSLP